MDFTSSLTQIASFGISIVERLSIIANSDKDAEKIIPLTNLVYLTSSVLDRVANLINGNESKHPNVVKNLEEIRDNCRRDFQALLKALQSLRQVASSPNSGPLTSYLDGLGDDSQFNALFHSIETSSLLLKINLKELEDPDFQDAETLVGPVGREEQIVPKQPQQRGLNTGVNETGSSHGIQEYFGRRSNAARPVGHDSTPNYSPRPAGRMVGKASRAPKVTFAEIPVVREPHDDIHAIYEGYLLETRSRAKAKAKSKAMFFQPYTLNLFSQDEDFLMSQLRPASRKQHAHDLLCSLPAPAREEVEYYLRKINQKISSPYQWTVIGIEEEFVRNTTRWRRLLPGSKKKARTDPPSWLVILRGTERHPSCLPPEYPHDEMARLKLAKQVPDPELYDAEESDSETSYRQRRERERYDYENARPRKRHYYRDYIDEDPSLALGPVIPPLPQPRPFSNPMRFSPGLGPGLPVEAQVQAAQAQVYRNLVRDAARDQTRDILRDAAWVRGRVQLVQQQQLEQRRRLLGMSGMW